MKAFNFIIIKLTFWLIIGIIIAHHYSITFLHTLYIAVSLVILIFISLQIAKRTLNKGIGFGLLAYVLMLILGIVSYNSHNHKNFLKHYTNINSVELKVSNTISFRIKERLKPTTYNNKYVVELLKINENSTKGHVLLNIKKFEGSKHYNVDDILLIHSEFQDIKNPLNPNQFNYKAYLEKQNIYHQLYTEEALIFEISSKKRTIYGYADLLRQTINDRLQSFGFEAKELAIINALILGQRQDMARDMYTNYVNAGAIHILAVSGLHVGIILMILNVLLKPLERLKRGHFYKAICILILLWSFAVIAGLSASVSRAVTMFSILTIAMHLKRPTNIYNTLSISIFILLLLKPMFLFDVGFQMSYLAVFAIVSIQPLLSKLWKPKWQVTNYVWQIFTVTIAAQLGVLPISLFYFHQFPGLFFVSNLVIIPFLGLILGLGILIIILSLLNILPDILATAYGTIISLMNQVVSWVSKQEAFLIREISFDVTQVIATYLLLLASILICQKTHFKRFILLLISIVFFQFTFIYVKFKNRNNEFIIFHKSRYTIYGKKEATGLTIWHNLDSNFIKNEKLLSNYKIGNFITSTTSDSLQNIYETPNKTLLIIDSLGIYNVSFKIDYVLLRNSPRIHLKRMIDSLQPELIIADGSNYKSYVKRWKATCEKEKLPFHYTSEKGAFIIK